MQIMHEKMLHANAVIPVAHADVNVQTKNHHALGDPLISVNQIEVTLTRKNLTFFVTRKGVSSGGSEMNLKRLIEAENLFSRLLKVAFRFMSVLANLGVLPVISAIRTTHPDAVISIDTSKPAVAIAAIEAGAEIINDISGFRDPRMIEVARATSAGICAMHMQGTPQTMQDRPTYDEVVRDVSQYLAERRDALLAAGIERERICLDPGIGFGKSHEHSIDLMQNAFRLHELGCPLLVGHSRKGFLGHLLGDKAANRDAASLGASLALALQGIQVIRLHEVRATREAWKLFQASLPRHLERE